MTKLEQAAMDFCAARAELRRCRKLFRELTRAHKSDDGVRACFVGYQKAPEDEWCEACRAYPLEARKAALRNRTLAANRMMTQYRKLEDAQTIEASAQLMRDLAAKAGISVQEFARRMDGPEADAAADAMRKERG